MTNPIRYRLRTLLICMGVAPMLLSSLICVPQVIWDGRFQLNVRFVNETGNAIDQIEAADAGTRQYADYYVSFPNGREQPRWKAVNLDGNGVGQIDVNCSGHVSQLTGVELSYWQSKTIVVRVTFVDGSRSVFAADIPERGKRHLVVAIPTSH
jgi:hypothetical protein